MENCPCGSDLTYADCCEPMITGAKPAETAEALMRSRYTAHLEVAVDYLISTIHPDHREGTDENSIRRWAERTEWQKLEVLECTAGGSDDTEGKVEFKAHFRDEGFRKCHHEIAEFVKEEDIWYFKDGQPGVAEQYVRETPKVGRNDPCPCGSGKKFKKCCGN